MNLSQKQKKNIKKFCIEFYKRLDFAHNLRHMEKTIKIAEFIAKCEKADVEMVRLGAMLHQFHDHIDELKTFLIKLKLDAEYVDELLNFVKFRPHKNKFKVPKEVKIVSDADYLQVMGPYGVMREVVCNTKVRNKTLEESIQRARIVEKMFYKSLQTNTAKRLIKKPHKLMEEFWKIYDIWENDKFY